MKLHGFDFFTKYTFQKLDFYLNFLFLNLNTSYNSTSIILIIWEQHHAKLQKSMNVDHLSSEVSIFENSEILCDLQIKKH